MERGAIQRTVTALTVLPALHTCHDTGASRRSCTFDELAEANTTIGLKEFTRLLLDHALVPGLDSPPLLPYMHT